MAPTERVSSLGVTPYKWEVLRVHWTCLDKELVSPAVQSLETFLVCDVEGEDAAVCSPVEGHA